MNDWSLAEGTTVYHTMTVSKHDYQCYGQPPQQQPAPRRAVAWWMMMHDNKLLHQQSCYVKYVGSSSTQKHTHAKSPNVWRTELLCAAESNRP